MGRARGLGGMTSPLRGEGHAFESHRAHRSYLLTAAGGNNGDNRGRD